MNTQLVPFGKYKGQPVEALAQDREYCEWLMGQDWFRTRFVGIHTLIVNHFGDATETPEHNALQARFLDEEWCLRFCVSLGLAKRFQQYRTGYLRDYAAFVAEQKPGSHRLDSRDHLPLKPLELVASWFDALPWAFTVFDRSFEVAGVDVLLVAGVACQEDIPHFWQQDQYWEGRRMQRGQDNEVEFKSKHAVECKPRVGDDYPAILRQMVASHANVLVAGEVRSATVSVDQIRAIFGASDIRVRTVSEIEATLLPEKW